MESHFYSGLAVSGVQELLLLMLLHTLSFYRFIYLFIYCYRTFNIKRKNKYMYILLKAKSIFEFLFV